MKIALAQLNSNDNIDHNIKMITKLVEEAAASEKPEIIFFPENSLFFRLSSNAEVKALTLQDPAVRALCELSSRTQIALHLTTALRDDAVDEGKNIYNASFLIKPNQEPIVLYRKIHLFDIALKDQKPIRESDCFANGAKEHVFEYKGFKFGSSICYDIRFSELYCRYAKQAVDVILIPAAFLVKTGQAHWDVLLRARAIESQCYVLAAAQAGKHSGADVNLFRETYGNSMVVDPWGQVLSRKEAGVGLVYAELDKKAVESVRTQIPMAQHRRL
jgi:deaminated glutathione amidase